MSFILDSLKKAERERRMGAAPAIHALCEEDAPPAGPRPQRRALLVGILLANLTALALLAGIVLHEREVPEKMPSADAAGRRTAVETAPPHPAAVKPAEADAPAVEPRAYPFPPDVAEAPPAAGMQTQAPGPTQDRSRSTAVRFGPPVAASPGEATRLPTVRRTASDATAPVTATAETPPPASGGAAKVEPRIKADVRQTPLGSASSPASRGTVTSKTDSESSTPAAAPPLVKVYGPDAVRERIPRVPRPAAPAGDPAAAKPTPAAPQGADEQVPLLQELPPELREKLRNVKISVLVYDARPEASVVYIDSRRYQAGDRIGSEGYVLERITPDGIVLDYGDGKVKIGTGR